MQDPEPDINSAIERANALADSGCLREALAYYQLTSRIQPPNVQLIARIGMAIWRLDGTESAISCFRGVIASEDAGDYIALADALIESSCTELAEALYRDSIERYPDCAALINNLAILLGDLGKVTEARNLLIAAVAIHPGDSEMAFNLGFAYDALQDRCAAELYYRRAISLDPENWDAYYNLATCLWEQQRYAEAAELYRPYLERGSVLLEAAYNNYGICLMRLGRPEEALGAYLAAIEVRDDYPNAWFNLARTYEQLNQVVNAIDAYRQAVSFEPGNKAAVRALKRLEQRRSRGRRIQPRQAHPE
jgi:tetratricopeptide (TPR) repeat protein